MNQELTDVQARFRKGRVTRNQIANICWIIEKVREFQEKNIYFIDYTKASDCVGHNKLGGILKEIRIPDHLICLLRKPVCTSRSNRTRRGTTDWFKIGKGAYQGCVLSLCLFNFYTEYIMWNARLVNPKLESRLPGEIPTTSDMQMIPF